MTQRINSFLSVALLLGLGCFAGLSLLPPVASVRAAAEFQVVVNPSNPTDILTKDVLAKIFLKKLPKWDNGAPIVPVDQAAAAPIRAIFTKLIHGKPVSAIASYWQQQIFAGREVPPAEKADDAAVLAFVKATPGGIGYVGPGASTEGVKLISVR